MKYSLIVCFVICLVNLFDIRSTGAEAGRFHIDTDSKVDSHAPRHNDVIRLSKKCDLNLYGSSDSDSDGDSSSDLNHNNEIVIEGNQHFHEHNYYHIDVGSKQQGHRHEVEEHDVPVRPVHEHEHEHKHREGHKRPGHKVDDDDDDDDDDEEEEYHVKARPVHEHKKQVKKPVHNVEEHDYVDYLDYEGNGDGTYDVMDPLPAIRDDPHEHVRIPEVNLPKLCEPELHQIVKKLKLGLNDIGEARNTNQRGGKGRTQVNDQFDDQRHLDDYYYDDHIDDRLQTDRKPQLDNNADGKTRKTTQRAGQGRKTQVKDQYDDQHYLDDYFGEHIDDKLNKGNNGYDDYFDYQ